MAEVANARGEVERIRVRHAGDQREQQRCGRAGARCRNAVLHIR